VSEALPLLIVGGTLGAGKTALLGRWVGTPAHAHSAVLVNEPGDAPIDAHLIGTLGGGARTLAGGCACCSARSGLAQALAALVDGPRAGRFERVIVELSGLAHPVPLLEDFAADPVLRERFPLHGLATVVDAGEGEQGLEDPEARARVAAADVLLLSKTDVVGMTEAGHLATALSHINPHAEILQADADARGIWAAAASSPGRELRRIEAALEAQTVHDAAIRAHTVRFRAPLELSGFCLRLASWLQANAERVLRLKGLVAVRGRHGPAVIQAVGASLQPVRTLKEWPAGSAPGALVAIGRGLDPGELRAALEERS